ncbi:MAG: right-handed parallel beta-helix repeat-containing protein [Pseudomonadota bacterium]
MNFAFLLLGLLGVGGMAGGGSSGGNSTPNSQSPLDVDPTDNTPPVDLSPASDPVLPVEEEPVVTPTPVIPVAPTQSASGLQVPEIDFSDYDTIIDGATFNSTLSLGSDDSNTLIINSTFENINGSGITMRGAENVTIANSTFRNIDDFGILLRSSGSTDNVTIMGNSFENIGGDGIHAAKRFEDDVDHTNLIIYDNDLHDIGTNGFYYHGIYVQSSEAVVWGNDLTGTVGANGISIRGDGIVHDNYVDVTSGREYGSGIKYFSDHKTGDSKLLTISDNVVEANNLYSGIQLDMTTSNKPGNVDLDDWVVNDFVISGNDVDVSRDYVIDQDLEDKSWVTVRFSSGSQSNALAYAAPEDMPLLMAELAENPPEAEEEVDVLTYI